MRQTKKKNTTTTSNSFCTLVLLKVGPISLNFGWSQQLTRRPLIKQSYNSWALGFTFKIHSNYRYIILLYTPSYISKTKIGTIIKAKNKMKMAL